MPTKKDLNNLLIGASAFLSAFDTVIVGTSVFSNEVTTLLVAVAAGLSAVAFLIRPK